MPLDRLVCDNTAYCWYFDPPCEPLKVHKVKPDQPFLMAYDPYNVAVSLGSDFRVWTHASRDTCEAALRASPKPKLRYREFALYIQDPNEPRRPATVSVSVGGPFKPAGIVDVDAEPPEPPAPPSPAPTAAEPPRPEGPPR